MTPVKKRLSGRSEEEDVELRPGKMHIDGFNKNKKATKTDGAGAEVDNDVSIAPPNIVTKTNNPKEVEELHSGRQPTLNDGDRNQEEVVNIEPLKKGIIAK